MTTTSEHLIHAVNRASISSGFIENSRQLLEHLFLQSQALTKLSERDLHELNELETSLKGKMGSETMKRYLSLKIRIERKTWLQKMLRFWTSEEHFSEQLFAEEPSKTD